MRPRKGELYLFHFPDITTRPAFIVPIRPVPSRKGKWRSCFITFNVATNCKPKWDEKKKAIVSESDGIRIISCLANKEFWYKRFAMLRHTNIPECLVALDEDVRRLAVEFVKYLDENLKK